MDINQFVAHLQDPGFRPTEGQKRQLAEWGQTLDAGKDSLNDQARSVLVQSISAASRNSDPFIKCYSRSLRYALRGNAEDLSAAITQLAKGMGSVADQIASLNTFFSLLWSGGEGAEIAADAFPRDKQRRFWKGLIAKVRLMAKSQNVLMGPSDVQKRKAVITTQQLLAPSHAPTRDALEFARILTEVHGFEVLVISSREFNSSAAGALVPSRTSNFNEVFNGPVKIEYRGKLYQSYQPAQPVMDDNSLKEIFSRIKTFGPELIVSIGMRSVVAETLAEAGPLTLMYPTTASIPLTHKNHFMMWREPKANDLDAMTHEGIREKFLFWRHPGFEPPESKDTLTREGFGISDDAFVVLVVGQRLHDDVDAAFIDFMKAVLKHDKAHFVFAGHFHTCPDIFAGSPELDGRYTYIGFQIDIMGVNALADAYVNPKRMGGGSAIVYAMAADLPVYTMPYGDAYEAAKSLPQHESYEAIASSLHTIMEDRDAYDTAAQAAHAAAEALTSRDPFVEDIVSALEAYKDGTLTPWVPENV